MIHSKSSHPVEVKRISIRVWTLRSEIEKAIDNRIKECTVLDIPVYIEDIKQFYNLKNNDGGGTLHALPISNADAAMTAMLEESEKTEEPEKKEAIDEPPASLDQSEVDAMLAAFNEGGSIDNPAPAAEPTPEPAPEEKATPEESAPSKTLTPDETMAQMLAELESKDAEKAEGTTPGTKSAADEAMEAMLAEMEKEDAKNNQTATKEVKKNPFLDQPYKTRVIPDLENISYGFILLSDINMSSLLGFSKEKFIQGQTVAIEFLIPQSFVVTTSVTYCHHYTMRSRIMSATKPDYRLQCKFNFSFLGERDNLRNFLKMIEPTINTEKKPKKESKDILDIL
jgi:hypothetical protein